MRSVAYQLVREARLRAGLSQAALADRLGVTRSTVARYESADAEPDLAMLTRIAAECGFALRVGLVPADAAQDALVEDFGALEPAARLRAATRHARLAAQAGRRPPDGT